MSKKKVKAQLSTPKTAARTLSSSAKSYGPSLEDQRLLEAAKTEAWKQIKAEVLEIEKKG